MKKQLLPVGFYDLLFDEAEKNHHNINKALDLFLNSGYRLIKTPLVEFEDSFLGTKNTNSFCVIDVISGKSLVFRNDITLQISRLLATRLKQEKLPLKLCYVGDVLCARSKNLYADRQQTQVGLEIIGSATKESNFEVIETLLKALRNLRLKNLLIEFSLPNFLKIFLDEIFFKKTALLKEEIYWAVIKKDLTAIKNMAGKNAEIISKIATFNHDLQDLTTEILNHVKSAKITGELKKARQIAEFLKVKFAEISVGFDLFGNHKSFYYNKISFDVFCGNFSYPVARGGSYKIKNAAADLDAAGATIYMNNLRAVQ
jgi:ATP phosphoribosyltransferase regulatory subunit